MISKKRGQSTLEYALIIAVVIAALIALQAYIRGGVSGRLKASTDDIGKQFDTNNYTSAWKTQGTGATNTTETRASAGVINTNVSGNETSTRSAYDIFGNVTPAQHF